jgi:hypothetical protein
VARSCDVAAPKGRREVARYEAPSAPQRGRIAIPKCARFGDAQSILMDGMDAQLLSATHARLTADAAGSGRRRVVSGGTYAWAQSSVHPDKCHCRSVSGSSWLRRTTRRFINKYKLIREKALQPLSRRRRTLYDRSNLIDAE